MTLGRHLTRRVIRQVHLWLGLALCVPLVLLGLTGSVLVFEDELRAAFAPAAHGQPGTPHSAGEIVAAARAVAPAGFAPSSYIPASEPGKLATVRFSPPGRQAAGPGGPQVDVDPVSLAASVNPGPDLLRRVFLLHANLLLPGREGRPFVGWLGVVMLALGVSGLVNWWPRRVAWRAAFTVSRRARGYRLWRELHGFAGIWGLVVFLVVSFSGVYLAFPETVRAIVTLALPARDLRAAAAAVKIEPVKGAEPPGIDDAIALAQPAVPGGRLGFVFLPARPDQPYRVALRRPGDDRHATPVTVFVDPWRRRIAETLDPQAFSAGESLLAAQHALHAGEGYGPVWKLLVFFVGLLPALFSISGIVMWLKRHRRPQRSDIPVADEAVTARRAAE